MLFFRIVSQFMAVSFNGKTYDFDSYNTSSILVTAARGVQASR